MLNSIHSFIRKLIEHESIPDAFARQGFTAEQYAEFQRRVLDGFRSPPRIAIIGETGVGKSSTLNALFNAGQPISHTRACTQVETELSVESGTLRVFDMPGLGEDIEADLGHLETYRRVLPDCDVVLWVLKADNRAIAQVQRVLKQLIEENILQPRRLVVGLNQIDLLQPGVWKSSINLPDREQEGTISARLEDVRGRLQRVVELPTERIVAYSATRAYGLPELMGGLHAAADRSRMWLIQDRANFLTFDQLAEVRDV